MPGTRVSRHRQPFDATRCHKSKNLCHILEKNMRVRISLLAVAALVGSAGIAGAQQKKEAPKDEQRKTRVLGPLRCEKEDGETECRIFRRADMDSTLMKRAAIGVQLGSTGTARDTIGVFVTRVTPKGPAENAGIVEGDRLVSINGVDLRVNAADAGDSYASGLASRRVTRELQKLAPGAAVNLRVWSGGRVRDVRVTAGRAYDLRDGNSFGYIFNGLGDGMGMMGAMPEMYRLRDMPRINIQSFPKWRTEDLDRMRLRMERMPRIYFDGFPKSDTEEWLSEPRKDGKKKEMKDDTVRM